MAELADFVPLGGAIANASGGGAASGGTRKDGAATGGALNGWDTPRSSNRETGLRVTVVVPTHNEAGNIEPLLSDLCSALSSIAASPATSPSVEIIVVDDSTDETAKLVRSFAGRSALPVHLIHRTAHQRRGGPAGAIAAGMAMARGEWVLVMDRDLQHPPEAAAAIATAAMKHDVDVVVGTRNLSAGPARSHGTGRAAVAACAATLAKSLFPRRLATVSDPMSGLFAVRRSLIDTVPLSPTGSNVLLDILVHHPGARLAEVSYTMAANLAAESPRSARDGLRFLRQLARLRGEHLIGQLREAPGTAGARLGQLGRMSAFGVIGLSGIAVNTAALWFCFSQLGVHYLFAAAIATQASTAWNFVLVEHFVYRGRGSNSRGARATRFFVMNNALLLGRLPVLQTLVIVGFGVLVANAATLVALFLVRFLVSDRVIYAGTQPSTHERRDPVRILIDLAAPAPVAVDTRKRSSYLTYRYDIAGLLTIGSQIVLPELEFFRAQWIADSDVDIAVRVGDVGHRRPRGRAKLTEHGNPLDNGPGQLSVLRYEEHLGRLGANFRIMLGDRVTVEVGPLLARSPHVVYTNVIEALLRFVMVSRGYMLLHSACLSLDGVGVMLSALTDTGKTATVLRLLREHGGHFLSDDMTIVDGAGMATCFPKPLTISAHTLRAVRANELTAGEWRRLQVQSRLHSKGGRSFALALSRFNLPIMGINAITQRLVPPPKYTVDRLVSCRVANSIRVEELFIIERGTPAIRDLDRADTVARMMCNTDDAYGFPPFKYLAPSITIGGLSYPELRRREREVLASFLANVRARCVASDTYGWADSISQLVRGAPETEQAHGGGQARIDPPTWPRWGSPVATPWGIG